MAKKGKPGRPPKTYKIDSEKVKKITDILKIDWTLKEARAYAGISKTTHYNRIEDQVYFMEEIVTISPDWKAIKKYEKKLYEDAVNEAEQYPYILARKAIFKAITSGNDRKAMEFLSKRDPRYKDKVENDHKGIPVQPWVVILPSNNRDTAWQTQNKKQNK